MTKQTLFLVLPVKAQAHVYILGERRGLGSPCTRCPRACAAQGAATIHARACVNMQPLSVEDIYFPQLAELLTIIKLVELRNKKSGRWWDGEIRDKISLRWDIYRKMVSSQNELWSEYCRLHKEVKDLVR